jgi:hypothetical protein
MRGATIEEGKNMDHVTYPPIYNLLTTEKLKKKYQSHKSLLVIANGTTCV